jgi:WD40 repeat protein
MRIVNNEEFESEKARHGTFFAREDILVEVTRILDGPRRMARGWLPLLGGPGVGKSAILVHVLETLKDHVAFHFIRRGRGGQDRPEVVERSLCAQIEKLFAEHIDADFPVSTHLSELLTQLSRRVLGPGNLRLLLVIDGLDELALDTPDENPLTRFLPEELPKGVVVLCATRHKLPHQHWLEQREGVRFIDLDSSARSDANETTIRAYWEARSKEFLPPLSPALTGLAISRSAGNFLYATRLYDWLLEQPVERRDAVNIPEGLNGFLALIWSDLLKLDERLREIVLGGLGVVCSAREALPAYLLTVALGWSSQTAFDEFLRVARPFLIEEGAGWHKGARAYRIYHECLREFIVDKLGAARMREHHEQIVKTLAAWPPPEVNAPQRIYALRHAVEHRIAAGDVQAARSLCVNVAYLETKCTEINVTAAEMDLEATLRASTGEAVYDLSTLLAALSAEAREIFTDWSSLPVRLYNRLLSSGWTPEKIEQTLVFPAGPPPLRLRHRVRMETAPLRAFLDNERPLVACAVRPGSRQLLSATTDPVLRLRSLEHGEHLFALHGHKEEITSCAFSHNGKMAISTSTDGTVRLWDPEKGSAISTIAPGDQPSTAILLSSTACAFTRDDKYFAAGFEDGTLRLWNSSNSHLVETLYGHEAYITACDVTPDGKHLVTASRDESVHVWDLATFKPVRVLRRGAEESPPSRRDGNRWFTALALPADGKTVYAVSGDGHVSQWSLASGDLLKSLPVTDQRIDTCALTGNGRLLCGLDDGSLLVVSLPEIKRIARLKAHGGAISACAMTPDGQRVITASQDRALKLWELAAIESSLQEDSRSPIVACGITPDEKNVVVASADGSLTARDLTPGKRSVRLGGQESAVSACAISTNGQRIVSGSEDGALRLWHMITGERSGIVLAHTAPITSCAVLPHDRVLTASLDGDLKLWSLLALEPLGTLGYHGAPVDSCAVRADGDHALSLSVTGTVKLWDLTRQRHVWTLNVESRLSCAALTSGGRRVVLGLEDGSIAIYDTASLQHQKTIQCTEGRVLACSILPNSEQLVVAFEDGTLRVFSLKTYELVARLRGKSRFRCLTTTNALICAGDEDGNLWTIETDAGETSGPSKRPRGSFPAVGATASDAIGFSGISAFTGPPAIPWRARLRNLLAKLFPTSKEALIVITDLRLNAERIDLNGSAINVWHGIVEEAHRQRCIERLVQWLRHQLPENEDVIDLLAAMTPGDL